MSAIATNATTVRAVAAQLAAWGWPCELHPGWATRKNRQQTLVWESVTVHHTGAGPVATSYMTNPTDRPKLVVLCNAHVTKDHRIRIIAAGGSSHAGMSDRANYATMRAGKAPLSGSMKPGPDSATFSANRLSFGIEVDNNRGTPEWDEWMLGATVALCAALHKVSGWPVTSAPRVITHKELTRRKPGDPILDAGKLRSLVKAFLAAPYGPPGSKPYALGDRLLSRDGNDRGTDVSALIKTLQSKGYRLTDDGLFGPAVDAAVRDVQTKAGLAVDGIVGPATLAALTEAPVPEPTPTPEPPAPPKPAATVKLGVANMQSYDGLKTSQAWEARAGIIAKQGWTVVCAVETTEKGRAYMLAELKRLTGHEWKVWTLGGKTVAVLWDNAVWSNVKRRTTAILSPFGHGAVCAPLTDRTTKLGVDVIAQHTRPGSVATKAQKAGDVLLGAGLAGKWPAILAGDFNLDSPALPNGWTRATDRVDTLDKAGVQTIDAAYIKGAIKPGATTVVDPGKWSDHKWLGVTLTLS